MPGKLYVIATPLGHLDDLSERARRLLADVDRVACEDTRRTGRLLSRLGIDTRTLSCHRFNERGRLDRILTLLDDGQDVALVSDGGTPGVSDPGALLVREAASRGVTVVPVPGPSAAATLLSVSGLAAERYVFEGFLPHRAGERRRRLREFRAESRPVVFFESPKRIRRTLRDISDVLGERWVILGRELTKLHETIYRGNASAVCEQLADEPRGEVTVILEGADASASEPADDRARRVRTVWTEALSAEDGDHRRALRRAARALGIARDELQRLLDELG